MSPQIGAKFDLMKSLLWYLIAALGEIGGCFAFWAWLRLHRNPIWTVPGVVSLVMFGWH
jgi:small multidrug resistance family-3 protein